MLLKDHYHWPLLLLKNRYIFYKIIRQIEKINKKKLKKKTNLAVVAGDGGSRQRWRPTTVVVDGGWQLVAG